MTLFNMTVKRIVNFILFICILLEQSEYSVSETTKVINECPAEITVDVLRSLAKQITPEMLHGKAKGEAGKIGVIGGSIEYTGAPYFAAMAALKSGADLVYVITTESAAPVIKSYSPDLIVYPYFNIKEASKISTLLPKMDVVVIGPGLGREDAAVKLTEDIIKTCKTLSKPLVIDADGLYVVSKNPEIIKDYPRPGIIMTPNKREFDKLQDSVAKNYSFWGDNVSILEKGETDQFHSSKSIYNWSSSEEGTGRRAAGQGDILSGSLGTVFGWAINYNNFCDHYEHDRIAQSVAAFGSARLTRLCNAQAFKVYGRSMTASAMLEQMHNVLSDVL